MARNFATRNSRNKDEAAIAEPESSADCRQRASEKTLTSIMPGAGLIAPRLTIFLQRVFGREHAKQTGITFQAIFKIEDGSMKL
ncbi:hypothetical protein [Azomonas macrocytogenes]|uniref:Uncharacterized protein n=1 Tax=Azomonas macrocytogenes TaxID=69962 RepID=A0A839T0W0_AZOMA|nr:hypothetical protein [Azomonas macrocytogenes]MBB3103181.1 hypothetical protein [Azomonas macrocytogenes]